jgi:hypothetical protein
MIEEVNTLRNSILVKNKKREIMKLLCVLIIAFSFCITSNAKEAITLPPISKTAKHPAGVNLKLMSKDPKYGYSDSVPIKVGHKDMFKGPASERA